MKKLILPALKRSTRDREYNSCNQNERDSVVYTYLFESKAHREIDQEILNINSKDSHGYQAMGVLHYLGLTKDFKGLFSKMDIEDAIESLESLNNNDYNEIINILKRIQHKSLEEIKSKNWLLNVDSKLYDYGDSFASRGYIYCMQTADYSEGDFVFLYCEAPFEKILYKTVVKKTDMTFHEITDEKMFWKNQFVYEKIKNDSCDKLELIATADSQELTLSHLLENGLTMAPQDTVLLSDNLYSYINKRFINYLPDGYYIDIPNVEGMSEGLRMTVTVDRYERSLAARNRCIKENGCYCHVCHLDFEKTYGELGKGFIHVHHIKPLSEIGSEYVVDYKNDLIPLCPNCHAMIHRKLNGNVVTLEQLKKLVTYYKELNRE